MYFSGTGVVLHQARRRLGYSQKELAGKLCVSVSQVESWERGRSFPERETLTALCRELSVTPSELMLGVMQDNSEEKLLALIEQTQQMEKQRRMLIGAVVGLAAGILYVLAKVTGGNEITDLISKGMMTLATFGSAAGIFLIGRNFCISQ